METNIAVEAGKDDPVIVAPWADPSGTLQYVEAREGSAWIDEVAEAGAWPEMRAALLSIHAATSRVFTVKCDAWVLSDEEKELDFGPAPYGLGAYFDVVGRAGADRTAPGLLQEQVEKWAHAMRADRIEARCDFVIRPAQIKGESGYAVTVYVFGYGASDLEARQRWSIALERVSALLGGG